MKTLIALALCAASFGVHAEAKIVAYAQNGGGGFNYLISGGSECAKLAYVAKIPFTSPLRGCVTDYNEKTGIYKVRFENAVEMEMNVRDLTMVPVSKQISVQGY